MERIDCVVAGAGVIGLAAARTLAMAGREVVILEREGMLGTGISSRNSEVIHAGMYYPADSLKARFCVAGNRMLQDFAKTHGVPFRMVGKLIVATDEAEERQLSEIMAKGRRNGVANLRPIPPSEAMAMEPELRCTAALWSPDTGILDTHAFMLALLGDAEAHGAAIAYNTPVESGRLADGGMILSVGGASPLEIQARTVVITAGLHSSQVARAIGLPGVPPTHLCKGNYFSLTGKQPFQRLVYPVPVSAGLGVHYTLDLGGCGRFGPDVEWTTEENYSVDKARCASFYDAIRRYWPHLHDGALEPAFAGIRPKLQAPGEPVRDFLIMGPREHGVPGAIALCGIESPGLTAALALAEHIVAITQ